MPSKPYRKGVVAVFQNSQGMLLGFRRVGTSKGWQFPQGGHEPGEHPEQTLYREVLEETGCDSFSVLKGPVGPISYNFPATLDTGITRHHRGQKQHWFLCSYRQGMGPDLSAATDQEFDRWCWLSTGQLLAGIVPWKKEAYLRGLILLGLLPQREMKLL